MKYIKRINELNRETYIDAARKSYSKRHYKRSSNIFSFVYKDIPPMSMKDKNGNPQDFKLIGISEYKGGSFGVMLNFRSVESSTSITLYMDKQTYSITNTGSTFSDKLIGRRSAVVMKTVLTGPLRDFVRDLVHEADLDLALLDNFDNSINRIKVSDMYTEQH